MQRRTGMFCTLFLTPCTSGETLNSEGVMCTRGIKLPCLRWALALIGRVAGVHVSPWILDSLGRSGMPAFGPQLKHTPAARARQLCCARSVAAEAVDAACSRLAAFLARASVPGAYASLCHWCALLVVDLLHES